MVRMVPVVILCMIAWEQKTPFFRLATAFGLGGCDFPGEEKNNRP